MSHFKLLVISKEPDDVERLLAPYDEAIEVEPYEDGGEMTTYNPRSKWDWYEIGGRWSDSLFDHDGAACDVAQKKRIHFERIGQDLVAKRQRSYAEAMGASEREREWRYAIAPGETEDEYVRRGCKFSAHAVVTPDGEWHERGRCGWHAEFQRIVREADDDHWFTIVDFHI